MTHNLYRQKQATKQIAFFAMVVLTAIFLVPIFLVLVNSFKSRLYISSAPF